MQQVELCLSAVPVVMAADATGLLRKVVKKSDRGGDVVLHE